MKIAAVFLTGAGKFIFMDWLNLKLPFILIAILGWTGGQYAWRNQDAKEDGVR